MPTRFNRRSQNNDECDPSDAETVSLFPNKGVPLGAKKTDPFILDNKSLSQAHAYLLGNCDEVQEYISYENEPSEHLMGPYIPKDNSEVLLTRTDVPETIIDVPSEEFVTQQLEVEYEVEFEDEPTNEFEDESKNEYGDESENEYEYEFEDQLEDDRVEVAVDIEDAAVDTNMVDLDLDLENGKAFVENYKEDKFEYIQTLLVVKEEEVQVVVENYKEEKFDYILTL
uniref:ALG2-interacting protein X n=1 Tax=Solanum tuberosum TaxID=4113 RepID=M1B7K4_SOLTU